jgi:predicted MFS family arabinose efflux permease
VLAAYAVVAGVSQMLWLNFAPLLSLVERRYGVSELAASLLVLVFPLLYVVFSVPAGALIDTHGYRYGVGLGAVTMTLFACVRVLDAGFWPLLVGQIGIAVAQPYVVNGVSKLVADWFDEGQGALATGLATMGMFLGMAIGMAATPALVSGGGLRFAMSVFAALTAVSTIAFFAFVHAKGGPASSPEDAPTASHFGALLRDPQLRLLVVLSFLGLGVFNGLTTWLEPIVAARGIDSEQAGLAGGAILLGGIVGAVVIPPPPTRSGAASHSSLSASAAPSRRSTRCAKPGASACSSRWGPSTASSSSPRSPSCSTLAPSSPVRARRARRPAW